MLEIERPIFLGLRQQFDGILMLVNHLETTCTLNPSVVNAKEAASFVKSSDNESTSVSRVTVVFVFSSQRTREGP